MTETKPGVPAVQSFACPTCDQPSGSRCLTATGNLTTPHIQRWRLGEGWIAGAASRDGEVVAATEAGFTAGASSRQGEVDELIDTVKERDISITGWRAMIASGEDARRILYDQRNALQAEFDAYKATHPEPAPVPTPVPAGKMLVGAAYLSNDDPAPIEKVIGRPLNLRRTYWKGTQVTAAVNVAKADHAAGRIPFLSFKLPASWASMAAGTQDAWVTGLRDRLSALGGPVWVVFHHEPEGDGNLPDWLAMQKHILPLVAAPNITPGVCVTGYQQVTGGAITFDQCWPGAVAKFLAVDLYQRYGTVKNGKKQTTWTDLKGQLAKVNAFAKRVGVPWVNAETGITDEAFAARPSAMTDLFAAHRDNGASALCYFDTSLNSAGSWPMTGAKLTAFAQAAS